MKPLLRPPQAIADHHVLDAFCSGVTALDDWLKKRARPNQLSGASRTFVAADPDGRVLAYYALASSAVSPAAAPGRFRRNMPDPIPVVVLGRLAVDQTLQGAGLGRALFADAAKRALYAAEAIGVRGLVVHALSDDACAFYRRLGLDESPLHAMTLMVTMADLRAALALPP